MRRATSWSRCHCRRSSRRGCRVRWLLGPCGGQRPGGRPHPLGPWLLPRLQVGGQFFSVCRHEGRDQGEQEQPLHRLCDGPRRCRRNFLARGCVRWCFNISVVRSRVDACIHLDLGYCLGCRLGRSSSLLVGMTAVTKESKSDHGICSATGHVIVVGSHSAGAGPGVCFNPAGVRSREVACIQS